MFSDCYRDLDLTLTCQLVRLLSSSISSSSRMVISMSSCSRPSQQCRQARTRMGFRVKLGQRFPPIRTRMGCLETQAVDLAQVFTHRHSGDPHPAILCPGFFKTNLIKCKTCKSLFLMISVHRNSSPTHAGGNLTAQAHKMDLSGGTGPGTGEGKEGGVAGSGGICNLSAILSDLSCGDRRAPGCEKKVHKLDVILHSTEKTQHRWLRLPQLQTMSKRG